MRSTGASVLRTSAVLLLLAAVALALHARIPSFTDPDSLYHIRHAWIYRTGGVFQSEFPWVWFSAIRREASNLWYGFHVLLIPFTLGEDLIAGIRVAGVVVTFGSLALVWVALARLRVRWAPLWTLFFAMATADSLYRLTMVRPHPLSLGLALLLFALLCEERPPRRAVLAAAALFAWIHVALAWVPVLILAAVWAANRIARKPAPWRAAGAMALGLAAGALARPNPIGGIRLAAIQVVTWLAQKRESVPLEVGRELKPFGWNHFADQLVPIAALVLLAIVFAIVLAIRRSRWSPASLASLLLLALFFTMSFTVARRSNELFVAFAVVFVAGAVNGWVEETRERRTPVRLALLLPVIAALIAAPVRSWTRFSTYLDAPVGPRTFAERYKESALWLRDHAAPGEIVYNVHWDAFSQLFFWNPQNRYASGNDPVFLYALDPDLYRIAHEIETDSWGVADLHDALVGRFRASWLVAQKGRTPQVVARLRSDARFELAFEDRSEAVFRIRP